MTNQIAATGISPVNKSRSTWHPTTRRTSDQRSNGFSTLPRMIRLISLGLTGCLASSRCSVSSRPASPAPWRAFGSGAVVRVRPSRQTVEVAGDYAVARSACFARVRPRRAADRRSGVRTWCNTVSHGRSLARTVITGRFVSRSASSFSLQPEESPRATERGFPVVAVRVDQRRGRRHVHCPHNVCHPVASPVDAVAMVLRIGGTSE